MLKKKRGYECIGHYGASTQGQIRFTIKNIDTELVRGWRVHRIEQYWFYVLSRSFELDLVKIDDLGKASPDLRVEKRVLKVEDQQVIHVPVGYGAALRALEEESELLVLADYGIEHAKNDDYIWPIDYFVNR